MLGALTLHTAETIELGRNAVEVFDRAMQVC